MSKCLVFTSWLTGAFDHSHSQTVICHSLLYFSPSEQPFKISFHWDANETHFVFVLMLLQQASEAMLW